MVKRAWTGLMVLALAACAQIAGIGDPDSTTNGTVSTNGEGGPSTSPSKPDGNLDYMFDRDQVLDFGTVLCGQTTTTKTLQFKNISDQVKTYTIDPPGDPYGLSDDRNGSIRPGETATISIAATPRNAGAVPGSLVIRTDGSFVAVQLQVTSEGAKLDWSPSAPDMGAVNKGAGGNMKVTLVNSGNVGTALSGFTLTSGDADFLITPDNIAVGKNASVDFTVTLKSGDVRNLSATFTPNVTGVCGAVPTLLVKGQRVDSDLTIGTGDFGRKNCNTSAGQKDIKIQNYASIGRQWQIDPLTKFDFVNNSNTGTVAAGTASIAQEGTISVKPKVNIPDPGAYDELMPVHISDAGTGANAHTLNVQLHVDVHGAKLAFNPTALTFAANGGQTDTKMFDITNSGNEDVSVHWTIAERQGGNVWGYNAVGFLPQGKVQKQVQFSPSGSGAYSGKLKIDATVLYGPLCNDPGFVGVSGTSP